MTPTIHTCPLCAFTRPFSYTKIPIKSKKKINEIKIDIAPIPEILSAVASIFPCAENKILSLNHKEFLPKSKVFHMENCQAYYPALDNLLRLCYLSTIEDTNTKLPFTEEVGKLFTESFKFMTHTNKWLGWRGILSYILLGSTNGTFSFVGYAKITQTNETQNTTNSSATSNPEAANQILTAFLIFALAAVIGITTNLLGLWLMGRNPESSSNKSFEQQNCFSMLKKEFRSLSLELGQLYFEKKYQGIAKQISQAIKIETLTTRLNDQAHSIHAAKLIGLEEFAAVVEFVKSDGKVHPGCAELRILLQYAKSKSHK